MKTILVFLLLFVSAVLCYFKVSYYIVTERAVVTHWSRNYVSFANFSATRKVRRSPMYYVDIHYTSVVPFDDTFKERNILVSLIYFKKRRRFSIRYNSGLGDYIIFCLPLVLFLIFFTANLDQVDFYFYQFLSNEYRRSFVEMHFYWCSLIHNDQFFGAPMRQGRLKEPCPYPPGDYHMYNMSIPTTAIPPGFPFTKGRIFANLTHKGEDVFGGYIDMELKEKRIKNK